MQVKPKVMVAIFCAVGLFMLIQDWLWVKFGWQAPPFVPPTEAELIAASSRLRSLEVEPFTLTEVRFVRRDSDNPVHDYVLEFVFNRLLTEGEMADYAGIDGIWEYHVYFPGEPALEDILSRTSITSFDQQETTTVVSVHEDSYHPLKDPKGWIREYHRLVDEAFQPGGLKSFAFGLHRTRDILGDQDFVAQWRSEDLIEIEPGRWQVPEDIDTTPTPAALSELSMWKGNGAN